MSALNEQTIGLGSDHFMFRVLKVQTEEDCKVQQDDVNQNENQEHVKIAMIVDANAGVKPVAVMIKSVNTFVADVAVLG